MDLVTALGFSYTEQAFSKTDHSMAVCATYPALKCVEKADAPLPHLSVAEIFPVLANEGQKVSRFRSKAL